jgi:hypothetical protein
MNTFKILTLAALIATSQAAVLTCESGDWIIPGKTTIPAGPDFISPSSVDLLDSTTDSVHFIFENPMVAAGVDGDWKRNLKFIVAAPDSTYVDEATLKDAIDTSAAGAYSCTGNIATDLAQADLYDAVSVKTGCKPTFDFALPWEEMMGAGAKDPCGWVETASNALYFNYTARVHVYWEDWDGELGTRAAMTYFPIQVDFQKTINQTDNSVSNNTKAYVEDSFTIEQVTYAKGATDVVVTVSYQIQTHWPYFPLPNKANAALDGGVPATGNAAGLTVPYIVASSPGAGEVVGTYDGASTFAGACGISSGGVHTAPADGICTFTQTVTYTYAYADHCEAGSSTAFKFGFATCVYNGTNEATNQAACLDVDLKTAGDVSVGSFTLAEGLDLCKAPANTYSVVATIPFAAASADVPVDVGKQLSFSTKVTTTKQITSLVVWDAYVYDNVKDQRWTLRTNGGDGDMKTPVAYSDTAAACADGSLECTVALSYTPNVGVDQEDYMIIYTDRTRGTVTLDTVMRLRFYWDTVNAGAVTRRLMYRDQTISSIAQVQDLTQSAKANIRVSNVASSTEASSGLSTAAIAGIATAGVVLVASAGVIGALVYRKRRAVLTEAAVDTEKGQSK